VWGGGFHVLVDCAKYVYTFTSVSVERSWGIFARLGNTSPRKTDEEMETFTKERILCGFNISSH